MERLLVGLHQFKEMMAELLRVLVAKELALAVVVLELLDKMLEQFIQQIHKMTNQVMEEMDQLFL